MLLPRSRNIGTVRTRSYGRPSLDENNRLYLICRITFHTRNVTCCVGQERIRIFPYKIVSKFPVSFLEEFLSEPQELHPRKCPTGSRAVLVDNHGFDVRVDPLWHGSEHIPRLKQSGPEEV